MKKNRIIIISISILFISIFLFFKLSDKNFAYIVDLDSSTSTLKIVFLDIGQGDATLIEFPNKKQMLIDCAIDARIIEALGRHIPFYDHDLDYLLVTHPDSDHYGGCIDVLNRFEVDKVIYTGFEKQNQFFLSFMNAIEVEMGDKGYEIIDHEHKIEIGDVQIEYLYPDHNLKDNPSIPGQETVDSNNTSIVLKISYGENDILITADAEIEIEQYLLENYENDFDVEVYKAGHHGSESSSSKTFLEKMSPKITVISCGENSYGHPSPRILKRLERIGSEIWRTDQKGDIIMEITKDQINVANHQTY